MEYLTPPLLLWHESIYTPKNIYFPPLPLPSKYSSVRVALQLQRAKMINTLDETENCQGLSELTVATEKVALLLGT